MSDRAVGLLLLAFCGVMFWQTYAIRAPLFTQYEAVGAAFFPRLMLVALAALSLVLVLRAGKERGEPFQWPAFVERYRDVLVSLVLFPIYVVAIIPIGFVPATAVYLLVMQLALRPKLDRAVALMAVGAGGGALLLTELFQRYLHVVFPSGDLF